MIMLLLGQIDTILLRMCIGAPATFFVGDVGDNALIARTRRARHARARARARAFACYSRALPTECCALSVHVLSACRA